jgi:hypothetical protein
MLPLLFYFNLSSPSGIATGTALRVHAIRRFRNIAASALIKTIHFIIVFSEFFFCFQRDS